VISLHPRRLLAVPVILIGLVLPSSAAGSLNQWHMVNPDSGSLSVTAMTSLSGHPGSLYVASYFAFRRSVNGGASWAVQSSTPCSAQSLAVDPSDPMVIYLGCRWNGGAVKSTDGGATWTAINQGLTYPQYPDDLPTVISFAIDPGHPDNVYMTTEADQLGDIFASHDGGASWAPIHAGFFARGLVVSGGRMFAYDNGVITSDDGGQTWSQPASVDAGLLVADPADPQTVYAIALNTSAGGVSLTTDGGQTWTAAPAAPANIVSASVASGRIYLGTLAGASMSDDQGQTWLSSGTHVDISLIQGFAIAADPASPGHVWLGTEYEGIWELTFDQATVPGDVPYWTAGTLPVDSITATSAVLHGVVSATAPVITAEYQFQWGTSSSYDSSTGFAEFPAASQNGAEAEVSTTLTGLTPDTTYHVHLGAYARWWTTYLDARPDDVTFTTLPAAPPTVTAAPAISFRHSVADNVTLPVRISWGLARGTYPICSSQLQRSTDGGPYRPMSLASPLSRRLDTTVPAGHSYRFRVRPRDCNGLAGAWSAGDATAIRQPTGPPRLVFSRRWTLLTSGNHEAWLAGAHATMAFTGRAVSIVAVRGPHYGAAAVYLDGVRVETLHLHADSYAQSRLVFAHDFGASGEHTIMLRLLGTSSHPAVTISSFAVAR
jgi:photosystem II stability/assembly factor-like uncharacterized protein